MVAARRTGGSDMDDRDYRQDSLDGIADEAIAAGDVEELARLFLTLKDQARRLSDLARAVEDRLAEVMPDKLLELPGLPVMERRTGTTRTKWQSVDLFDHISRQFSIDDVRECLPLTGSLGWRTGKLRDLGLQVDEWCTTTPGRVSVQVHQKASVS